MGELALAACYELMPDGCLHGRRKVYTFVPEITAENVVPVLGRAKAIHSQNRREIQYLYNYYCGVQDVLGKIKLARPEINNKVTVNIANQIVAFKTAYFMSSPLQYVSAGGDKSVSKMVYLLNSYMLAEDKDSKDKEICDWMHICGLGVRMVLPDATGEAEGAPFCIYTLDPRQAFVIYSNGIGRQPLAGVILQKDAKGRNLACVYTKNRYFEIQGKNIINRDEWDGQLGQAHYLGAVPLVEYPNNEARLGAFEIVLPVLNTINDLESHRVDGVQDFVNAFDVFYNCEIDSETYKNLNSGGKALQIKTAAQGFEPKVERIASELSQGGVQTAIDDLTDQYIRICGLPNRNGGSSTSDTGQGVIFRDGWAEADSRANDTEKMFNRAERQFLRLVLHICQGVKGLNLQLGDIKIDHTRSNLSNMQSRMQILCEGLNNDKIHPKIPWLVSGMPNAEEWYHMSEGYYQEQQMQLERSLQEELNNAAVHTDGQEHRTVEQAGDKTLQSG